jgi:hypothetical protein
VINSTTKARSSPR